jgi:hypothetical protein
MDVTLFVDASIIKLVALLEINCAFGRTTTPFASGREIKAPDSLPPCIQASQASITISPAITASRTPKFRAEVSLQSFFGERAQVEWGDADRLAMHVYLANFCCNAFKSTQSPGWDAKSPQALDSRLEVPRLDLAAVEVATRVLTRYCARHVPCGCPLAGPAPPPIQLS